MVGYCIFIAWGSTLVAVGSTDFFFCSSLAVVCRLHYSCGGGGLLFIYGMWLLFLLWWNSPLKLCFGWLLLGILWSCIRGLGAHFELLSHALAHTCMLSHIHTHTCTLSHVLSCPHMPSDGLAHLACPLPTSCALTRPHMPLYILAHPPTIWCVLAGTRTPLHLLAHL